MATKETKPTLSTTEQVMKICLIVSAAIGCLIIVLAILDRRDVLWHIAGAVTFVALQWFFYSWVRARKRSE
jgi:hypothetical protein